MTGPTDPRPLTHREIQIVFFGLMLGMFLPAMTTTVVATALPAIVSELGGLTEISWVMTAYLLAATIAVPLVGKASDLYGRRPLFQLAIVVFVVGSILCGASQTIGQLVASRAVQGAAGGSLMALAMTTIGDVVAPRQRGRYQGYVGAVFAVASLIGPLVGGILVDFVSWRWTFYLNVPLGLLALVVTRRYLRLQHEARRARVDYLGAVLVTVAATALLLVSVWGGQQYPWGSGVILSLTGVAALAFALFVPVELRAPEPVLPLRLFRNRVFAVGGLLSVFSGAALFMATTYAPVFLQIVTNVSATASGFSLLPLMLGLVTGSVSSGRLITRWGRYKLFPILGAALMAVGYQLLSMLGPGATVGQAAVHLALVGAGLGVTLGPVTLAIQNSVDPRDLGVATAAVQFFRMAGGTLGLAIFGSLVNLRLATWTAATLPRDDLPDEIDIGSLATDPDALADLPGGIATLLPTGLSEAITFGFLAAVPLFVLGIAVALLMPELPLKEHTGSGPAEPPSDEGS